MDFTVRLTHTTTVTAQYAITGLSVQEGSDYVAPSANAVITFTPGQTETKISVPVINDNLDEEDEEEFRVTLSNPQNAVLEQNRDTAAGIIKDNDEVALHIDDISAREKEAGAEDARSLRTQKRITLKARHLIFL